MWNVSCKYLFLFYFFGNDEGRISEQQMYPSERSAEDYDEPLGSVKEKEEDDDV